MYQLIIGTADRTDNVMARSLHYSGQADLRQNLTVAIVTKANTYMPYIGQIIELKSSASGTTIFGGVIKTLRKAKLEPLAGSSAYVRVEISSDGYNAIPQRRTVTVNYSAQDTGNIVSALRTIMNDASFNDNIGLGDITAGVTLEDDWYSAECRSVKDILDDMATISGCKWYIDNTKALNFVSEDTVTTAAHTISATDTESNLIHDITVTESLENYANKVFVSGALGDDGNILYVTASLTSEITARAAIEGTANSSGVYGMVVSDPDIDTLTAASTVADNYLKKYGVEPQEISFYSYETDWVAGTQVLVNLPEFGMTAAVTCLIEEVTITSEDPGILKSYVKCTKRNSANFSTQKSQSGVEFFEQLIATAKEGKSTSSVVFDEDGNAYVVQIYVQDDEPAAAKAKAVWIDTNDYTRYDQTAITTTATITNSSPEVINCSGAFTVTLSANGTTGVIKKLINAGTSNITIAATINGVVNMTLQPEESVELITDGTNWRF